MVVKIKTHEPFYKKIKKIKIKNNNFNQTESKINPHRLEISFSWPSLRHNLLRVLKLITEKDFR